VHDDSDDRIAATIVHRSLIRPDREHLVGAERGLIVMLIAVAFILAWLFANPVTITIGVLLVVVGVPALREMAKRDPIFSRVVTRRLQQQREYLAHANVGAPIATRNPEQGS
jgi:type IV secretory pathway TrbD component